MDLIKLVSEFYEEKARMDKLKKEIDYKNKQIKELMEKQNLDTLESNGFRVKVSKSERVSFDDDLLLDIVKDLNVPGIIKTKEYVDMKELEKAIYEKKIDASLLSEAQRVREVVTLRVTKTK